MRIVKRWLHLFLTYPRKMIAPVEWRRAPRRLILQMEYQRLRFSSTPISGPFWAKKRRQCCDQRLDLGPHFIRATLLLPEFRVKNGEEEKMKYLLPCSTVLLQPHIQSPISRNEGILYIYCISAALAHRFISMHLL